MSLKYNGVFLPLLYQLVESDSRDLLIEK
jgi:hypothetical protein